MSRHSLLTGSDLHISKFNTVAGTPLAVTTPGNTAEPILDTTNNNIYVSDSTTNADWQLIYSQQLIAYAPSGTTETLTLDKSFCHELELDSASGNITLTLSNPIPRQAYIIKIIQGVTARTVTWPGTVKWPGGTAPVISTTNNDEDLITLWWDGTSYYGNFQQAYA